jgi:hypothetical protein
MTLIDTEGSQRGADGFADGAESGRNKGARMMGGMFGLWGEKKVAEERKSDVRKCDENPGK